MSPAPIPAVGAPGPGYATQVNAALTELQNAVLLWGTFAGRPPFGTAGRHYYATDQGIDYYDNGTTWMRSWGDPRDTWMTDFGAKPDNLTATAALNVTAYNSAKTQARTSGYSGKIVWPKTVLGNTYYVNASLNFEHIHNSGTAGSEFNQFAEDGKVAVVGTGINGPTFEISAELGGVGAFGKLTNLSVTGDYQAVKVRNRAFVAIRDCVLVNTNTTNSDRAVVYLENSFWIWIERTELFAYGAAVAGAAGVERSILMVASSIAGAPIQGVAQVAVRDVVMAWGQVRFENRTTTQTGDSAHIEFVNVTSESCGTQAFFTYRNNGATAPHGLARWTFHTVERADATIAGASFVDMDASAGGGGQFLQTNGMSFRAIAAYTQYLFKTNNVTMNATFIEAGITATVFDPASVGGNTLGFFVVDDKGVRAYTNQGTDSPQFSVRRRGETTDRWLVNGLGAMQHKEGLADSVAGAAVLVAGTKVINTTAVTANSRIYLSIQALGTVAAPKAIGVTARVAGASFTITSSDATDTSTVAWEIQEPV